MEEKDYIIECPNCGTENNRCFVMYYGDLCLDCDFDIKEYFNEIRRQEND